ncbi:hypothetical protein H4R33_000614 [Dimargaris cristalligena]|uniref:DUF1748-domain-containing protein n=1 Tax=Dimargaris cristalligena TaxID=215637 RepID=A0A4P9ZWR9_9FUNG|nr:hypothetical protein H4R33_000614 [Dimargaris cristalligena]RKP37140.1 hypothetical protein BJ085DRAFT_38612 [Dimargaris cristalligena]|eukprot:RKP37140.1 hypothetical protein BJ085DRAFT_38612 [Dimargaris cristalligena]
MVGKLIHYAADAVLISAVLAGIRRSSGLTFKTDSIESKEFRSVIESFLNIGEKTIDFGTSILSTTSFFERRP